MDLTPLDAEQRRDVEGLVTRRRLEPVPADIAKAERFLRAVLTTPPGLAGARRFDQVRRARNSQRYQGIDVGTADADLAVRAARALYDGAFSRGLGRRR